MGKFVDTFPLPLIISLTHIWRRRFRRFLFAAAATSRSMCLCSDALCFACSLSKIIPILILSQAIALDVILELFLVDSPAFYILLHYIFRSFTFTPH